MLCSFGWNPVIVSARSKALDLDGKTQHMPLHAPDYTPNPCHEEDDYFRSKWTLGESWVSLAMYVTAPGNPTRVRVLLRVGRFCTGKVVGLFTFSCCGIYPEMPLSF